MASDNKDPWYPWYPRDFAADELVMRLTLEEEGALHRLIDHQWLHGSVPSDFGQLGRICKNISAKKFQKMWAALEPLFPVESAAGRLQNRRLERVRNERKANRDKKVESGKLGAEARWGYRSEDGTANGSAIDPPMAKNSSASASASASALADTDKSKSKSKSPTTVGPQAASTAGARGRHRKTADPRGLEATTARLVESLAQIQQDHSHPDPEEMRRLAAELVLIYWAGKVGHGRALLSLKRKRIVTARLRDRNDDPSEALSEALYVVDGSLQDRQLQGDNDRNRKYNGIETIFRDRAQVERLARLGGYDEGRVHPTAAEFLAAVTAGAPG